MTVGFGGIARRGAAATLVVAAACVPSRVPADADVRLGGTVHRQNGDPAGRVAIGLRKEPGPVEGFATGFSLGLICLTEVVPQRGEPRLGVEELCRGARGERTDDRGRFLFHLTGADTQGALFRNASTMELATRLPARRGEHEGPAFTLRFLVQHTTVTVPIRFWEPGVDASADGGEAVIRWSPGAGESSQEGVGRIDLETSVRFERNDVETVWTFGNAASPTRFDPRLLEDARGTVAVYATARGMPAAPAVEGADLVLRSARFRFAGPAGAPASRGRPCFVVDPGGRAVEQKPCRLTDGDFHAPYDPRTGPPCETGCPPEPTLDSTFVDLGSARTISLVVVRGCEECAIEASSDARRWTAIASGSGDLALEPRSPLRARYVRVTGDLDIDELREVSVWDSSAAVRPGSLLITGGRETVGEEDRGARTALIVTAAFALALVLPAIAIGARAIRRRRF